MMRACWRCEASGCKMCPKYEQHANTYRADHTGDFLPWAFENFFVEEERQAVLKAKFCSKDTSWPAYMLPVLLKADSVGVDRKGYKGRTLLWLAWRNGRMGGC